MAHNYGSETPSYARALGFFDAVYGFALTLLVTTVNVADESSWQNLNAFLDSNGSQFLSFVISFAVISVFWYNNHRLLADFKALDGVTIWANIAVMAFIIFIPFTTEANGEPELQHLALPTALYALNVAAAVLASIVMYQLALHRGLVDSNLSPRAQRAQLLDTLITPAVFLLSIPVTYWAVSVWDSAAGGKLFWLLLLVAGPVSGHWKDRIVKAEAD